MEQCRLWSIMQRYVRMTHRMAGGSLILPSARRRTNAFVFASSSRQTGDRRLGYRGKTSIGAVIEIGAYTNYGCIWPCAITVAHILWTQYSRYPGMARYPRQRKWMPSDKNNGVRDENVSGWPSNMLYFIFGSTCNRNQQPLGLVDRLNIDPM